METLPSPTLAQIALVARQGRCSGGHIGRRDPCSACAVRRKLKPAQPEKISMQRYPCEECGYFLLDAEDVCPACFPPYDGPDPIMVERLVRGDEPGAGTILERRLAIEELLLMGLRGPGRAEIARRVGVTKRTVERRAEALGLTRRRG